MRRRTRKFFLIVALCHLVGFAAVYLLRSPIEEGRCKLRRRATGDSTKNEVIAFSYQNLYSEPVAANDSLDSSATQKKSYSYRMAVAGEYVPLVLDVSKGSRLTVDSNKDGSLSGESDYRPKAIKPGRGSDFHTQFGPIRVSSGTGDDKATSDFYALSFDTDRGGLLALYPATYRRGRLRLGRYAYNVAVADGDYDGRFGSVVSLPADDPWWCVHADSFAIDFNRNGKFEMSLAGRSEVAPLGRMVYVDGTYYAIDLAADGSELALEAVEPALGRLRIDPNEARMNLRVWSDAADRYLSPAANSWDLPVGAYQGLYGELTYYDSHRREWTLSTGVHEALGELGSFEIRRNETTRIQAGPPFVVTANVQDSGDGRVSINAGLRGRGGEHYGAAFLLNGGRPAAPTFAVISEDGKVLVKDKFKYG